MSNAATYKFITYEEYSEVDEAGNHISKEYLMHPYARVNYEKTEVVISTNDGTGTHTRDEALAHIATWVTNPNLDGEI